MSFSNDYFQAIFNVAQEAGEKAGEAFVPTPMVVYASDLMGNRLGPNEVVNDGVCGFAWVHLSDGRSAFAKWLLKSGHARKGTYSGVDIRIRNNRTMDYNQSMGRKEAHARAMAKVLKENGINCYAESRMD